MPRVDATRCPLCGRPNACASVVARDGNRPDRACSDCWCARTSIPTEVLARVPAAARGLACICAECTAAERARTAPAGADRCDHPRDR